MKLSYIFQIVLGIGITLCPLISFAQNDDISITITAETEGGNDGTINLQVNSIYHPIDNPAGINSPPFSYQWRYEGTPIPEGEYIFDEIAGSCDLYDLEPGEYCVTVTQNIDSEFPCSVNGCFTVEPFVPGPLNIEIDGVNTANINECITLAGIRNNNGGEDPLWFWETPSDALLNCDSDMESNELSMYFTTAGVKTISLEAVNGAGEAAEAVHEVFISSPLEADFDYFFIAEGISSITYGFTAEVTGAYGTPTFTWEFEYVEGQSGNPTVTTTNPYVTHLYDPPGVYTVRLTVTDELNSVIVVKTIPVVSDDFVVQIVNPVGTQFIGIGDEQFFTAEVVNAPGSTVSYTWDFGDGTRLPNVGATVSHIYESPGCKTILVIAESGGYSTHQIENCLVAVGNPSLEADGISIMGDCQLENLKLLANASGGSTGSFYEYCSSVVADCGVDPDINLNDIFYRRYRWNARLIDNTDIGNSIFMCPESPCTAINLYDEDIQTLLASGGGDILVSFTVTDNANNEASYEGFIPIYPNYESEYEDIFACPGTELVLGRPGNSFLEGRDIIYQWLGTPEGLAALSCTDCRFPTVNVLEGIQEYTVVVTIDGFPLQDCNYIETFNVTGKAISTTASNNGSALIEACALEGSTIRLGGSSTATTGGSGEYMYSWAPFNGLDDPTLANPLIIGLQEGEVREYELLVTDDQGCTGTSSVEVIGTISDITVDAGEDILVCFGDDITLGGFPSGTATDADGNNIDNRLAFEWNAAETEYNSEEENPLIASLTEDDEGIYSLIVTDTENGCMSSDEIFVTVNPEISVTSFENSVLSETACEESGAGGAAFSATPPSVPTGFGFSWSPSEIVFEPDDINPLIKPTAENPFATLTLIEKATGCSRDVRSKIWVLFEQKPTVDLGYNSEKLCAGEEVCFELSGDMHFPQYDLESVGIYPSVHNVNWQITSVETGTIIGNGVISFPIEQPFNSSFCVTFPNSGSYSLKISGLDNVCGNSDMSVPIEIGATIGGDVCDNNTSSNPTFVMTGLYTGVEVAVAPPQCDANIIIGNPVDVIATNTVVMLEGFHAASGSRYLAKIGDDFACDGTMLLQEIPDRSSPAMSESLAKVTTPSNTQVRVFPNPFENIFTLVIEQEQEISQFEMIIQNSLGQPIHTVMQRNVQSNKHQFVVDLSDYPAGLYWCLVRVGEELKEAKIIKN